MNKLNKIILSSALTLITLLSISNTKVDAEIKVNTKPTIEEHLKTNWDARNPRIDVKDYNLTWDQLNAIIYDVHVKEPQYYYAFRNRGPIDDDKDGKVDYLEHDYLLDRREELEVEFERVKEQAKYATSDLEKALVVHDWLCDTITYSSLMGNAGHDIEGAILEKRAVCEGYALAYQYFMNRFGIPCKKVSGESNSQPHAWNQIMIDGEWYMVDATWDDTREPKVTKHNNFLVSGEKLAYGGGDVKNKHYWDHQAFEACTSKKYDNMFWDNHPLSANYTIRTYNGKLFYKGISETINPRGIMCFDLNKDQIGKAGSVFIEVEDLWPLKGQEYVDFTQMDIYNDELYYSKPTSIWKKSLINNSAPVKVYDALPGTYIWDVEIEYGRLYFDESVEKEGVREFKSIKIDEYQKQTQPLAVSHTTLDLYLGDDFSTIQAAGPSTVTYTSDNPTIVEVKPVWEDASASVTPKSVGTTTVRVKVNECDGYLANEKLITVNVKKSPVEVNAPNITFKNIGNNINIKGDLYINRTNSGTLKPTGNININVLGDGNKLLANDLVKDISSGYTNIDINVPNNYSNYKLVINYDGDNYFDTIGLSKEYNNSTVEPEIPHTHSYNNPTFSWLDNNNVVAHFKCNGCTYVHDINVNSNEIENVKPTCDTDGHIKYEAKVVFNGNAYIDYKTVKVNKTLHSYSTPVFNWNADNTKCEASIICSKCNNKLNSIVNTTIVEDIKPTCETDGHIKYEAKVVFNGNTYSDYKTVIVNKTLHSYSTPVFNWSANNTKCEAGITCSKCNNKLNSIVNTTIVEDIKPSCETDGYIKYEAKVVFNGNAYTDYNVITINKLEHNYGDIIFNWTTDCSSCEIVMKCNKCNHVLSVTTNSQIVEDVKPTCEADGYIKYEVKAQLNNTPIVNYKVVNVDKLNHNYVVDKHEFNKDYTQLKVYLVCSHCNHSVFITGNVETIAEVKPTCKDKGSITYRGSATYNGETYTFEETKLTQPLGHNYVNGKCEVCGKKEDSSQQNKVVLIIIGSIVGLGTTVGLTMLGLKLYKKKKNK